MWGEGKGGGGEEERTKLGYRLPSTTTFLMEEKQNKGNKAVESEGEGRGEGEEEEEKKEIGVANISNLSIRILGRSNYEIFII